VTVRLEDTRHFAVVPSAIAKYMVCYLLCYGLTEKINLLIDSTFAWLDWL